MTRKGKVPLKHPDDFQALDVRLEAALDRLEAANKAVGNVLEAARPAAQEGAEEAQPGIEAAAEAESQPPNPAH